MIFNFGDIISPKTYDLPLKSITAAAEPPDCVVCEALGIPSQAVCGVPRYHLEVCQVPGKAMAPDLGPNDMKK